MGGSIVPCILSHAVVNSVSVFALPPTLTVNLVTAAVQTALGIGSGVWILRHKEEKK